MAIMTIFCYLLQVLSVWSKSGKSVLRYFFQQNTMIRISEMEKVASCDLRHCFFLLRKHTSRLGLKITLNHIEFDPFFKLKNRFIFVKRMFVFIYWIYLLFFYSVEMSFYIQVSQYRLMSLLELVQYTYISFFVVLIQS